MANIEKIRKYKNIHMIGIGGFSMSGIAEILNHWGFHVTGTDTSDSEIISRLKESGIDVTIGHCFDYLKNADAVIYTAAISKEDPEILEAQRLNIPIIERSTFLGELTRAFPETIGVSGTHGKTTTTSMVSLCFLKANKEPNVQVGAILKEINGNYRIGNSDYFIIEACEYVESFLKFSPKAEIILNIDNDHLDYFKTFENVKNAFVKYVKLLPKNGLLVVNADDSNCLDLLTYTHATCITYGIANPNSDFTAKNINFNSNGFAHFDVYYHNEFYSTIELSVPGEHNILNALACISLCHHYAIPKEAIQSALFEFTGADRRMKLVGTFKESSIFDDYGHHPTEILANAKAIQNKQYAESWIVFQPHTYSRTKNLLDEFAKVLLNFDHIIVTDIYAARENDTYGISSKDLVDRISLLGKEAIYLPDFEDIVNYLAKNVHPQDLILTQGAGTITQIGPMLLASKEQK